jgi:ABC-type transport system involved in cytochrome bd biosynthesis fused ATPase/permease subunit
VLGALGTRLRGRTVLVITHREQDLALVDEVVRLERGAAVVL